ncbi:hypothetical protein ACOSQ2_005651 [Xanthoceras sorbifolium]
MFVGIIPYCYFLLLYYQDGKKRHVLKEIIVSMLKLVGGTIESVLVVPDYQLTGQDLDLISDHENILNYRVLIPLNLLSLYSLSIILISDLDSSFCFYFLFLFFFNGMILFCFFF